MGHPTILWCPGVGGPALSLDNFEGIRHDTHRLGLREPGDSISTDPVVINGKIKDQDNRKEIPFSELKAACSSLNPNECLLDS